jgi:hypothetical protein
MEETSTGLDEFVDVIGKGLAVTDDPPAIGSVGVVRVVHIGSSEEYGVIKYRSLNVMDSKYFSEPASE